MAYTVWKSNESGMALLDCLIGITMFTFLASLLIKALNVDLKVWMQHLKRYEIILKKTNAFILLDAWFNQQKSKCKNPDQTCPLITIQLHHGTCIQKKMKMPNNNDVITLWIQSEHNFYPNNLFVSHYQGRNHWQYGLYSQSWDKPKQLLLGGVVSVNVLQCLHRQKNQEPDWINRNEMEESSVAHSPIQSKFEINKIPTHDQVCEAILLSIQFENNTEWRQVLRIDHHKENTPSLKVAVS